jgi:predicted phosphodiesterase
MLNKRYIGKDKTKFIFDKDYLVLEEVPDIVVFGHTHNPNIINFKSITLVNPGSLLTEFKPVVIDLSTRDYSIWKF